MTSVSRLFPLLFVLTGLAAAAPEPVGAGPGSTPAEESPAADPVPADVPPLPPPETPRVELESAWVVPAEGGGERLVSGERPDAALEQLYTARLRFEGGRPAAGLEIVIPIPAGLQYVAGSATGPGAEISFSVDGGRSFGAPGDLVVPVSAEGGEVSDEARAGAEEPVAVRPARPADYSHVRWLLPGTHPPGRRGLVSFRARPAGDGAGEVP